MNVVIDGVTYTPAGSQGGIGVGITTHNRPDILKETLSAFAKLCPDGTPIVVVDDGSDIPAADATGTATIYRHAAARGIPAAKNRCIEELMNLGVQHLFLFDDDTRPDSESWWTAYVDSPEPHLQYCWTHNANGSPVPKMDVLYRDSTLKAYGWSMGCMLYVRADVIDKVGGMRPEFGRGMEEHAEWSQRIHNAGFTSFVHQDLADTPGLFHAGDEDASVERSFGWTDRGELLLRNEKLRLAHIGSADHIEYRQPRNVVLTCYFTGQIDPQRGVAMTADPECVAALEDSIIAGRFVVLNDCFPDQDGYQRVDAPEVAYRQRWLTQWQWLRDHPEVRYCWLLDATDVRMLNNPFPAMKPGTLYCGWEPRIVGNEWIRDHGSAVTEWIDDNAQLPLLNCGVVGGDRTTLMRLCHTMNDLWASTRADPLHEMVFFNIAAYSHEPRVTGPQVTTLFKHNTATDPVSWFAHK